MRLPPVTRLGSPDIKLASFEVWVQGRQFPDMDDYWDGNWLLVTAHCGGLGADVWVNGPIIHLSEIRRWHDEVVLMQETLSGKASLSCIEPNIFVELTAGSLGHIRMKVKITPDHMVQKHSFKFDIDQTYLNSLLVQCKGVLDEYPIRGQQPT